MGWVGFGWTAGFFTLIGGYYVLRYVMRRFRQSLFIAGLSAGWVLFGAVVVGLIPHPLALALMLGGALFGTIFLVNLLDELRRGSFQKGQGDGVSSRRGKTLPP